MSALAFVLALATILALVVAWIIALDCRDFKAECDRLSRLADHHAREAARLGVARAAAEADHHELLGYFERLVSAMRAVPWRQGIRYTRAILREGGHHDDDHRVTFDVPEHVVTRIRRAIEDIPDSVGALLPAHKKDDPKRTCAASGQQEVQP